jgi:hypothetical protein
VIGAQRIQERDRRHLPPEGASANDLEPPTAHRSFLDDLGASDDSDVARVSVKKCRRRLEESRVPVVVVIVEHDVLGRERSDTGIGRRGSTACRRKVQHLNDGSRRSCVRGNHVVDLRGDAAVIDNDDRDISKSLRTNIRERATQMIRTPQRAHNNADLHASSATLPAQVGYRPGGGHVCRSTLRGSIQPPYNTGVALAIRSTVRRARAVPILGLVVRAIDRWWWARTIARAGVVDDHFVAVQMGRPLSARGAIRRYVRGGFAHGFSLNPLFSDLTVSRALPDSDRVPALYAYLIADARAIDVSPVWSAQEYVLAHPEAAHAAGGPFVHLWRRIETAGDAPLGRGAWGRTVPWAHARAAILADASPSSTSPAATWTVPVVYLCRVGGGEPDPDRALRTAAEVAEALACPVVISIHQPARAETLAQAQLLALLHHRITVSLLGDPADVDRASILVDRDLGIDAGSIAVRDLCAAATREGVNLGALVLDDDGTVYAAGTVGDLTPLAPLFSGHPIADAVRAGSRLPTEALLPGLRAIHREPAAAFTATDVVVRRDRTATSSPATAAYAAPRTDIVGAQRSAIRATRLEIDPRDPRHLRRTPAALQAREGGLLRWAIRTSAPASDAAGTWGDWNFARSLADALTGFGQDVAVDAYPARTRATAVLDDVTVVLRGPFRISPPATGVRILWIFSHPDEITQAEIDEFDLVYAASVPWAKRASARFGREVSPLLQCTDPGLFAPSGLPHDAGVTFVGTARGIARPSVVTPLAAGIDVHVYGPDWRGFIPARAIRGTSIPNNELSATYESASVVLNDHWPAMRAEGFISNRAFDVIASGGRVLSDDVEGIEDLFGGLVRVYHSPNELVDMLRGDVDQLFPSGESARDIIERIRKEETYEARARTLLSDVLTMGPSTRSSEG